MTISLQAQGDGQLGTTKGTLYTVAASTQAIVRTITLVNTIGVEVSVNIYYKVSGGTSRLITPKNMIMEPYGLALVKHIQTLEAAGIIEGDASVATTVDYTISGVEDA